MLQNLSSAAVVIGALRVNPVGVCRCVFGIIRIHHEREDGIEKSVPRITSWHHETCQQKSMQSYPACKELTFLGL